VDSVTRAILQNLCWASALGVAVGLSPFSSPALMPSIAAGLATGGALFWYLERLRRQKSAREPREEVDGGTSAIHLPPSVVASLALLGVVFAPTLAWLYAKSTASIWTNGHGLFTPLIMGYLAYSTLRRDDGAGEAASRWGFVFVSVGLGLVIADLVPQTFYVSTIGLILVLPGLALLFYGTRRARALALPLSLGFFVIPIPAQEATHLFLQLVSAAGTVPLLRVAGYPVFREETLLLLPGFVVEVTEACSGFSALYAAIFMSVILVAYAASPLRKLAIALAVLPVALISNIVRVFFLVVLVDLTGVTVLETTIHPASGAITFWIVIAALGIVAGRKTIRSIFA
jgi:exosortase